MKKYYAEFLGAFFLVFAGCGAAVVNQHRPDIIGHAGVALTFGLVVLAMIYTIGEISGAHMNPAVTTGFVVSGRMPKREWMPYVAAQSLGALAAAILLRVLFPHNHAAALTLPHGPAFRSFIFEFIMTWFLMFVVLNVSTGAKEKGITAGIAVGAVIALEAMFGGPISGASMNPARSLGPALASFHFDYLWIYLAAPVLGAVAAVYTCGCTQSEGCCPSADSRGSNRFVQMFRQTWNS